MCHLPSGRSGLAEFELSFHISFPEPRAKHLALLRLVRAAEPKRIIHASFFMMFVLFARYEAHTQR